MNGKQIVFHPEALAEARAAVVWYHERSQKAPQAFLAELEDSLRKISDSPQRWPPFEHGCRRYPLRRFPFFMIYRESESVIEVLAVAHGRRRPGYWRSRESK